MIEEIKLLTANCDRANQDTGDLALQIRILKNQDPTNEPYFHIVYYSGRNSLFIVNLIFLTHLSVVKVGLLEY